MYKDFGYIYDHPLKPSTPFPYASVCMPVYVCTFVHTHMGLWKWCEWLQWIVIFVSKVFVQIYVIRYLKMLAIINIITMTKESRLYSVDFVCVILNTDMDSDLFQGFVSL